MYIWKCNLHANEMHTAWYIWTCLKGDQVIKQLQIEAGGPRIVGYLQHCSQSLIWKRSSGGSRILLGGVPPNIFYIPVYIHIHILCDSKGRPPWFWQWGLTDEDSFSIQLFISNKDCHLPVSPMTILREKSNDE